MSTLWQLIDQNPALSRALAKELSISPLTAQVLVNRGVTDKSSAESFLKPRLAHLSDPMEIPNIDKAAKRLLKAKAEAQAKVMIFGDYDVDGVTGTAILLHTLKFLGIEADYYIPHRYGEGYSMSIEAVRKIAESGVKLIVTVDCGVSNVAEIAEANKLGMEVIVTDHHNLPAKLPAAFAIVNPKMIPDHPSEHLSGAGVAFKFAWALLKIAGVKDSVFLTSLLDLASLGTISDIVPLNRENRILAAAGLAQINQRKRLGIRELAENASLYGRISVRDVNFVLAPRINAAGRLEHASKSVELMITDDPERAKELAAELSQINTRRQGIGKDIKEEVFTQLNDEYVNKNRLVVLSGQNWHPGVIGIVASQVVDRFSRPTVLIGVTDGVGRGSARSIEGINIFNILSDCQGLFTDFGGHAGAAGFEIESGKISELIDRLQKIGALRITHDDLRTKIKIDSVIDPSRISLGLVKELEILDPHGEGNPTPVFSSGNLALSNARTVGSDGRHLKCKFTDGRVSIDVIGFGFGNYLDRLSYDKKYDIAYHLEANEWDGFEVAQLSLVDIKASI